MGGIGSGRQYKPAKLIKIAKANDAQNLPKYFEELSKMALDGDREALFYLINRHMGTPKAVTEITGEDGEALGAGMIAKLFTLMEARRKELDYAPLKLEYKEEDATE